jgi:hypothetical protein
LMQSTYINIISGMYKKAVLKVKCKAMSA